MFAPHSREELRSERLQAVMKNHNHPHEERIRALASAIHHLTTEEHANRGRLEPERAETLSFLVQALGDYVEHEGKPSGDPEARRMALEHFADLGLAEKVATYATSPHPEVYEPAREVFISMINSMNPASTAHWRAFNPTSTAHEKTFMVAETLLNLARMAGRHEIDVFYAHSASTFPSPHSEYHTPTYRSGPENDARREAYMEGLIRFEEELKNAMDSHYKPRRETANRRVATPEKIAI